VAVRDTAPLRVLCKERGERHRVAGIERLRCCPELVDHRLGHFATKVIGQTGIATMSGRLVADPAWVEEEAHDEGDEE